MSDMQNEMSAAVTKFVGEITEIAKQAARDQLDVALGGLGGGSARSSRSNGASTATASRGKGVKRDSSDLEKIAEKFQAFVKANPGMRIEQINAKLGTTTKDLRLPIVKLIANGDIKVKGKKRSTTYH